MAAHMTPDEFRRHGREVVDWVADYYERIESFPVLSSAAPDALRAALPAAAPEEGEPFSALLADMSSLILPGVTHWQHPEFFAYFPANASGPAILAELLSAGLGVQGMLWATSPACTELEQHMLDWLASMLDLPERFRSSGPGGGVIQDTASTATFTALLAALQRVTDGKARAVGLGSAGGRYAVYASAHAHSSVQKAVMMAGLGEASLRLVETSPDTLAMRPEHLRALIAADVSDGVVPVMAVAAVGTTGTGAVDPVARIGPVCAEAGVWLHVDAAWAGVAAVCPELREMHAGVDQYADSYCTNPHKWLLTNFDCDAFYVADRSALLGALSILPEYLRNAATESGAVVDFRDWHPQLGRRFRALKLWAVIRWYGVSGLQAHIRRGVALAEQFAAWAAAEPRLELPVPRSLSLVCFRVRGDDDRLTEALRDRLNASGELYLTHTKVNSRVVLRLAIGSPQTERRHLDAVWARIQAELDALV
jgi:aromatic-L-amino-acid decarboxylase